MKKISERSIALITGSSRGIGFSIAQELDKHGVRLILTGRSQKTLDSALQQLSSNDHLTFSLDFSEESVVNNFLKLLIENKIIPNILVHNLGGTSDIDTFPIDINLLRALININLEVAIRINEAFIPFMTQRRFGRIIHIGSDASITGMASPAYVISKSALNGYVKVSSRHFVNHGIMICAVLPGIIEHEGSAWEKKKINQYDYYKKKLEQMPLRRFGRPEEIASFVGELAVSNSMMYAGGLFELRGAMS